MSKENAAPNNIVVRNIVPFHHGENIMKDNIPDNVIVGNNIFLIPEEAILKIWWKLVLNQLMSVFWAILDLVYTDMIPNRMRNIHALK